MKSRAGKKPRSVIVAQSRSASSPDLLRETANSAAKTATAASSNAAAATMRILSGRGSLLPDLRVPGAMRFSFQD